MGLDVLHSGALAGITAAQVVQRGPCSWLPADACLAAPARLPAPYAHSLARPLAGPAPVPMPFLAQPTPSWLETTLAGFTFWTRARARRSPACSCTRGAARQVDAEGLLGQGAGWAEAGPGCGARCAWHSAPCSSSLAPLCPPLACRPAAPTPAPPLCARPAGAVGALQPRRPKPGHHCRQRLHRASGGRALPLGRRCAPAGCWLPAVGEPGDLARAAGRRHRCYSPTLHTRQAGTWEPSISCDA